MQGVTEKPIYYKDVALIRTVDGTATIVNDTGFMSTFLKRANDDYWLSVSYIQTNVKSKLGCGTPFLIPFYAPLDVVHPEREIVYDFKGMGSDEELVGDGWKWGWKQCLKMGYYVQKVCKQEILRMHAEFSRDENGSIWFIYASQIQVRECNHKDNGLVGNTKA